MAKQQGKPKPMKKSHLDLTALGDSAKLMARGVPVEMPEESWGGMVLLLARSDGPEAAATQERIHAEVAEEFGLSKRGREHMTICEKEARKKYKEAKGKAVTSTGLRWLLEQKDLAERKYGLAAGATTEKHLRLSLSRILGILSPVVVDGVERPSIDDPEEARELIRPLLAGRLLNDVAQASIKANRTTPEELLDLPKGSGVPLQQSPDSES